MLNMLNAKTKQSARVFRGNAPQIFDLLQLSKTEHECRAEFLKLKRRLPRQKLNKSFFDILDDTILRRKAHDAALYYRFVRRERIRYFRAYVDRLPTHNSVAA